MEGLRHPGPPFWNPKWRAACKLKEDLPKKSTLLNYNYSNNNTRNFLRQNEIVKKPKLFGNWSKLYYWSHSTFFFAWVCFHFEALLMLFSFINLNVFRILCGTYWCDIFSLSFRFLLHQLVWYWYDIVWYLCSMKWRPLPAFVRRNE